MKRFFTFMALLCCVSIGLLQAQTRTITGTVTNEDDGFTMPGVSVLVKGTTVGTVTNFDGQYNLSVPEDAQTLVFSFIGMATQEIALEGQSAIDVVLKSDSENIDEVVVTAYGSKGKVGLKGAISVVSAEELEQIPVASFDQMLQGKTTGLQISSGSGQPGSSNTKVRIRGTGSIMASNEPLYVVDGVPIEPGVFGSLNANDFETVSVLKDASSTAIYGSRASNGVILITTKSGTEGATTVNVRHQSGVSIKGTEKFDMMNSSEKLWFEQLAKKGPGWELSPMNPNYDLLSPEAQAANVEELNRLRQINTDWQEQFYRTGKTMSNEVNFSGGTQKTKYYVSYQNYYQEGISYRSDLNRNTGRLNLDHQLFKNLKVGINTTIGQSRINNIESEGGINLSNPYAAVYLANPWEEPYDANGQLLPGNYQFSNIHLSDDENSKYFNPYAKTGANALDMMSNSTDIDEETKFIGAFTLEWDILPYLTAKSQYGIDYRHTLNERWVSPDSYVASTLGDGDAGRDGVISEEFTRRTATSFTNTLDFKKVFNDIHTVSAVLGTEYLHRDYFGFGYTGYGLEAKLPETPAAITPGDNSNNYIASVNGYKSQRKLFSLISLVNYTYDGKYTFSGSLRRDGSSAFGTNNQYATLYSAGFTWDVTREAFMSNVDWVNNLKFRISYGTTGNQEGLGNFESKTLWSNTSYANNAGYYLSQAGDPDIKWEVAHKFNVGIDYHLFNNRLNGSIDFYNDRTSDLFIAQTFSAWDGVPGNSKTTNAGEMRNRGAELLINYDIIRNRELTWSVGTNLSYNDNEITDLGQVNEFEQGTSIVRVGLPISSHYIVKWAGVNPATGDAMYYTKDGQITSNYSMDDSVADFGSSEPPFFGGFNTSLSYKGFELSAHFTFAQGFYRFNNQSFFQENPNFAQFNLSTDMLDIWQKPGDITEIQGAHSQREFSSKDIEDASYVRFRNLMVAYNMPQSILKKVGLIKRMKIYGQGQNLFTWTKWTGFDPEDSNNLASYEYPTPRIFTVGLDLTF
ncbi:MAG: TonB-dependent receptor [Bacteroidales bacterium]|nr:TonB-dependent receptor [Bacteroidales bacterium]